MCEICGCGDKNHLHAHHHSHADNQNGINEHDHSASHLHFGDNAAGVTVPGSSATRVIELQTSLHEANKRYADQVRNLLSTTNSVALNLLSSPGSGKTTLLSKTLEYFLPQCNCLVIEGDQQTTRDADRLAATGAKTVQINTGKGCHLDAHMVLHGFEKLPKPSEALVFIENVGNLVCPAGFDLGEKSKVVLLSVTEGEDKPLKYPDAFYHAEVMLITKIDLLPYVDFNLDQCIDYARQINPEIRILPLSAKSGEGLNAWFQWLASAKS
jgi:hydrogenase nickel incorporation protein HypB